MDEANLNNGTLSMIEIGSYKVFCKLKSILWNSILVASLSQDFGNGKPVFPIKKWPL